MWDQDNQGNWKLTAAWKAHSGSVWKVTWAHPEFGQVLATCSFDRTAAVWEEIGMFCFFKHQKNKSYVIFFSWRNYRTRRTKYKTLGAKNKSSRLPDFCY